MLASEFARVRSSSASWAAARLASSPTQAARAGSTSARPKEKLNLHGWGPSLFITLRWAVASSGD